LRRVASAGAALALASTSLEPTVSALASIELTWQRPWLASLLVLPALIWFLAAQQDRTIAVWSGTLALWRDAAHAPARTAPSRLPPIAVRLLVGALAAAVLALAGPTLTAQRAARAWTVVVDRSPSMYLPWNGSDGPTRLARALERARGILEQARASGDSTTWVADAGSALERAVGSEFPREWLAAPAVPRVEPVWAHHDARGTLWVSDAAPDPAPRAAGCVASGGSAAPGFVSARGVDRVAWDGERLVERAGVGQQPEVLLDAALPAPVERVARAWAEARGCAVVAAAGSRVVLELTRSSPAASGGPTGGMQTCERDGWTWDVDVAPAEVPAGEVWLSTQAGRAVVVWEPGTVTLLPSVVGEPRGDPADFALSWAELLDRAALPPEGVVALSERVDAGEITERLPQAAGEVDAQPASGSWLLSALAATFACAALALRRR
jgi:hypothetical protein